MKRTIRHPDGRVETHEGTAEELATYEHQRHEQGLSSEARRQLDEALKSERKKLEQQISPVIDPATRWERYMGTGQPSRCLFDGLPPGTYHLSCPCPRHSTYC